MIPSYVQKWFAGKNWQIHAYQQQMLEAYANRQSTLLIAPTGGGKTLSGFLPVLIDIHEQKPKGLHTLYISPLKALTNDIERNLIAPISQIGLEVRVESRTGDTPSHKRQRQRSKPPHILLTTPESLMLMLSYTDAPTLFANLKCVIIDEVHSFAHNKRGDFTTLALARLEALAPGFIRFGLSATVAKPDHIAHWLGVTGEPASLIQAESPIDPQITLLESANRVPYSGFTAKYAIKDIYEAIRHARTSIVFVNARSQAELMFQQLWDANEDGLPIAIYHGSLSKEQRRKTENMMAENRLRAIVATSALELGIDWGNVDLVIQIGAPKGVSRLLQRIGRSNHQFDKPSQALLVPTNRFEVMECAASIHAIQHHQLDGEHLFPGSMDVIVQFIINCACSAPVTADELYQQVLDAVPYQAMERPVFDALFQFAIDGGYVLRNYERYARLIKQEDGRYTIAGRTVAQRHRQNIGTIVEAARLKVKILFGRRGGKYVGEVEESFAQGLTPGDTFFFAGETLEYLAVRDMVLEVRRSKAQEPKLPSYAGAQMPLSTFLAEGVRSLLNQKTEWHLLPSQVKDWLEWQEKFSSIPGKESLLIEHFPKHKRFFTLIYTFEGRKANNTLGMLITRRMERLGMKPLSFSLTDYALSITSLKEVGEECIGMLLSPDILGEELESWIQESPMLKRAFRHVATITGLTEQRYAGSRKTMKQVTFSTDLIYDVLRRHEPGHILLTVTQEDAFRELLDVQRLSQLLMRFEDNIIFRRLPKPSPLSIPILLDVRSERIKGSAAEALLEQFTLQEEAEQWMEDVRAEFE